MWVVNELKYNKNPPLCTERRRQQDFDCYDKDYEFTSVCLSEFLTFSNITRNVIDEFL